MRLSEGLRRIGILSGAIVAVVWVGIFALVLSDDQYRPKELAPISDPDTNEKLRQIGLSVVVEMSTQKTLSVTEELDLRRDIWRQLPRESQEGFRFHGEWIVPSLSHASWHDSASFCGQIQSSQQKWRGAVERDNSTFWTVVAAAVLGAPLVFLLTRGAFMGVEWVLSGFMDE